MPSARVPLGRAGRHTPSFVTRAATVAPWSGWWGRRRASRTSRSGSVWEQLCRHGAGRDRAHPEHAPDVRLEGPRARPRRAHARRRRRRRRGQGRQRLGRRRGAWWTSGGTRRSRDPTRSTSAATAKYALRTYVEARPAVERAGTAASRWGHAIVVPYSDFADDFATPDCPRWSMHGRRRPGRPRRPTARRRARCRRHASACRRATTSSSSSRSSPAAASRSYDVGRRGRRARGRRRPAHPGAGHAPVGHPAAQAGRGPRRSRQRQDGPGPDRRPRS